MFDVSTFSLPFLSSSLKCKNKICKLHPRAQNHLAVTHCRPIFWGALTGTDFIWNHLQSSDWFPPPPFCPATGLQKGLAWLHVLQLNLLCDFMTCCSKLATRLWSGTWDLRGVDVDARRTCCVRAATSQFGNIIEKVSCHAEDQTGERGADAS